jgi:hypothetical protein
VFFFCQLTKGKKKEKKGEEREKKKERENETQPIYSVMLLKSRQQKSKLTPNQTH